MKDNNTDQERIDTALDVLVGICKMSADEIADSNNLYEQRAAAEEILRHYREARVFKDGITVRIEGHVPVRPMVKGDQ